MNAQEKGRCLCACFFVLIWLRNLYSVAISSLIAIVYYLIMKYRFMAHLTLSWEFNHILHERSRLHSFLKVNILISLTLTDFFAQYSFSLGFLFLVIIYLMYFYSWPDNWFCFFCFKFFWTLELTEVHNCDQPLSWFEIITLSKSIIRMEAMETY